MYYDTYANNKLSCLLPMYWVHLIFSYLLFLSGLVALLSRCVCKDYHPSFGKLYIIMMLWAMGSSLLIHNEGLPLAVLVSFLWTMLGLTLGWFAALRGWKVAHGTLMVISWFNIAGRAVFPGKLEFSCYTRPAYKTNQTFLPERIPETGIFSVGVVWWGLITLLVPALSVIPLWCIYKKNKNNGERYRNG